MYLDVISQFIWPTSWALIVALYLMLIFLKSTPYIPIWSYAWIILLLSITACLLYYGLHITSVVQATICAGVALLAKDLIHLPIEAVRKKR